EGEAASFIVSGQGKHVLPFATSQDHIRAYNGDQGPNTGVMGAYSQAQVVTDESPHRIMNEGINPRVATRATEGPHDKAVL
ncbi:phosphoribosylamine--glycine ligase, partial [Pseudoalteromonas sp. S4488]